jgi:Zn-dependent oligopeptidase
MNKLKFTHKIILTKFQFKRHQFKSFLKENLFKPENSPPVGLYGVAGLFQLSDISKKSENSKKKILEIIKKLKETEVDSVSKAKFVILNLDNISNEVYLLLDPFSLCSFTHPSVEWKNATNEELQGFSGILHEVNTNPDLHLRMCEIVDNKIIFDQLNEQEKKFISLCKTNMENKIGSHLSPKSQQKILNITSEINQISAQFIKSINENNEDLSMELFPKLVAFRHIYARLLGQPSFAHFSLKNQMIETPEKAFEFLKQIHKSVREKMPLEFQKLSRDSNGRQWLKNPKVDVPTIEKMSLMVEFNLRNLVPIEEYFTLSNCLNGLNNLCQKLFGITLKPCEVHPNEIWHPDVRKISFEHETEGNLGFLYLDLFARINKLPIPSVSPIALGKKISETEYQTPVVALLMSLLPKRNGETLLTLDEVKNMFHEFGHVLHSILGRTDFQNTSGIRTAIDFVETPSQFFENFAKDYRVVSTFAKHYITGEVLPEEFLNKYKVKQNIFSTLNLEREIIKSLIDLEIHGIPSEMSFFQIVGHYNERYSCLPYDQEENPFSIHSMNYAASYYSYTYCRVSSSHMWHKYFAKDPFSREAGERFRMKFLHYGGIKSPKEILKEFLEEEPNPKYLLKDLI